MKRFEFLIASTWDGEPVLPAEQAQVLLSLGAEHLEIEIDAPLHGDPVPPGPVGSTDSLWEYEVVELFLLGEEERYLELEFGPQGHFLGLALEGVRNRVSVVDSIEYEATRAAGRWRGRARLAAAWLPSGVRAANAFAIHGEGRHRRYLAASPVPGDGPDFHRLGAFPALDGWVPRPA